MGDLYEDNNAFTDFSFTDTSLGGNEAINCRWGFNRDDDIIQPSNAFKGQPYLGGLGRVYYEQYESQAQYLYITAGVPEFSHLSKFYGDAIDTKLAADVNSGGWTGGILSFIGTALGTIGGTLLSAASTAITLPFMAARYIRDIIDTINGDRINVTKYYDFRSAMPQYHRYVNSMLVHICTNLGLYKPIVPDSVIPFSGSSENQYGKLGLTGGHRRVTTNTVITQEMNGRLDNKNVPQFLKEGISLYRILAKRSFRNAYNEGLIEAKRTGRDPADVVLEAQDNYVKSNRSHLLDDPDESAWTTFKGRAKSTSTGADRFICFRLDKGTEASETFTNTTGQSTIQQTLNGMVQQGKNLSFSLMGGKLMDIPIVNSIVGGIKDFANGIISQLGVTNVAAACVSGSGFFDIPEVWQGSSYNKNYSFSMTFRAPYGDSVTVAQSLYVPLSMLLPLVLPRSVGQNSYTSPFIVRAYSKGMFAIPLGIVDSMQITRGSQEFGWNINKLPLVIKVNFSIKDLSPLVHMSFRANESSPMDLIFGSNSNFQEYLMTIEGLGLQERLLWKASFIRRLEVLAQQIRSILGSPAIFGGTLFGDMRLVKLISNFFPQSQLSSK